MADVDGLADSRQPEGAPGTEECKLFVGGISWHMTDAELQDSACPGS